MGADGPLHRAPVRESEKPPRRRRDASALGRHPAARLEARHRRGSVSAFHVLPDENCGPATRMTANSKIIAAWNRFFFEPIPAYSLALFRIAFAFVVLVILGLLAPDALDW